MLTGAAVASYLNRRATLAARRRNPQGPARRQAAQGHRRSVIASGAADWHCGRRSRRVSRPAGIASRPAMSASDSLVRVYRGPAAVASRAAMIAAASFAGRRELTIQYGVGSAGSSITTRSAPVIHGRCTMKAYRDATGPSSARFASGVEHVDLGDVRHREVRVVHVQFAVGDPHHDPAQRQQAPGGRRQQDRVRHPDQCRRERPGTPRAARNAAKASASGQAHHGTVRRSR